MSRPVVPLYQSRTPAGAVRNQVAGLTLAAVAGGFSCSAHALGGLRPRAGDAVRTSDGKRWRVVAAALENGVYTLTCEPEGGEAQ